MRILNLCVESDRIMGGRGEMNIEVMTRLQEAGHWVHHVCLDQSWIRQPIFHWSIPAERWPMPCWERPGISAQVMHSTVIHCLKLKGDFDVIVAHDWDMLFVGAELSKVLGIPWVATFHLFQHQMAGIEGREPTEEGALPIAHEWFGLLNAPHVVCVSHNMVNYARNHMGIDRGINVIHNGVQPLKKSDHNSMPEQPNVLFIGRLSYQKGYDLILDLAEQVNDFKISIAGSMPALPQEAIEAAPNMLRIRALEARRPDSFKYYGHVPRYDRGAVYDRTDIVVMPSRAEPFGIVALEAMANGIPLITTRVDGLAEFCNDNNSWQCEPSSESIEKAINECRQNGVERARKIQGGLVTANQFTWDVCAAKWEKLLEGIVNGNDCVSELRA